MVNITTVAILKQFIQNNPSYKNALEGWISLVKKCNWEKPQDIVETFGDKAISILGKNNRVIFDIKGNHLRVIAKYEFHPKLKKSRIYIKWIGTHAEYDKICKKKLQYTVDVYC